MAGASAAGMQAGWRRDRSVSRRVEAGWTEGVIANATVLWQGTADVLLARRLTRME